MGKAERLPDSDAVKERSRNLERINKADINWLDEPGVYRVNRLDAHSDHKFYKNEDELLRGESSFEMLLNGEWLFKYSESAKERPEDFYKLSYDEAAKAFDRITVPQHIEMAGYDKIHYINSLYPWEGHIYRRPFDKEGKAGIIGSFKEADYNPVGSYITAFDLPDNMKGNSIRIRFEGVEQAVYVYLNGEFVGYAEDSFTPSEFDLTPYIKDKDNVLAAEVHKRSSAAFLEDQDFFRFFGIFRDVKLIATPKAHIEDMDIRPILNEDNKSGSISVKCRINELLNFGRAELLLSDADGNDTGVIIKEDDESPSMTANTLIFKAEKIEGIKPWSNKRPYLYKLIIKVYDRDGALAEIIPYSLGFRRVDIRDNVVYLNGERLYICGVNRHEWNPESGRVIGDEEMYRDIEIFKRNNINAVRTCHYPDKLPWYFLCDEAGIYVMAETNLETHGSWQKAGGVEASWNVPGDSEVWTKACLDRAESNYEWFKNHTSVLFWSLGNESAVGKGLEAMNRFFKDKKDSRPVHYENLWMKRDEYEDTVSDLESRMYAKPGEIKEYLDNSPKKPFILCEYMHCMGNSLGGFNSYMELFDYSESFVGGFIWDYIDQAIYVTDEVTGKRVLRYGGDFDDRTADYEFSQNGIVFADRSEKPAMQEVRYFYGKYSKQQA